VGLLEGGGAHAPPPRTAVVLVLLGVVLEVLALSGLELEAPVPVLLPTLLVLADVESRPYLDCGGTLLGRFKELVLLLVALIGREGGVGLGGQRVPGVAVGFAGTDEVPSLENLSRTVCDPGVAVGGLFLGGSRADNGRSLVEVAGRLEEVGTSGVDLSDLIPLLIFPAVLGVLDLLNGLLLVVT